MYAHNVMIDSGYFAFGAIYKHQAITVFSFENIYSFFEVFSLLYTIYFLIHFIDLVGFIRFIALHLYSYI